MLTVKTATSNAISEKIKSIREECLYPKITLNYSMRKDTQID